MNEITALRQIRPALPPAELEAMRTAAREKFAAGTRPGPARQRWRMPALAGGLTAAAAGTAAAALTLTGSPAAAPAQQGTAGHAGTVVTAAWTVREDADGTVSIYLRQYRDPAALQQTLRADGVNALVRGIPVTLVTITPPVRLPGSHKVLRFPRPNCMYADTNNAPPAVQAAVVTLPQVSRLPVRFVIHPDAMPQGSALLLPFMTGMPASPKNDDTGVMALIPVVLNNSTVPACVPTPAKAGPSFGAKASF
ncbi:MAG TPA: hypothetical protein VEL03_16825 [Streptosporangiaceae bacterium]|nr:hypothetical protein [Streptosporangiaceae bacterium]